jgi:hypothetical protein
MANASFAVFKYEHGDSTPLGPARWAVMLAGMALVAFCFFLVVPLGVFALIALIVATSVMWPKKRICLGLRYVICGNTILYYRNVRRMVLTPGKSLTLHWDTCRTLRLEQDRFPTNARKSEKIAKNKKAKFEKVSGKIIDKVLIASPEVELTGIDREAHTAGKTPS